MQKKHDWYVMKSYRDGDVKKCIQCGAMRFVDDFQIWGTNDEDCYPPLIDHTPGRIYTHRHRKTDRKQEPLFRL